MDRFDRHHCYRFRTCVLRFPGLCLCRLLFLLTVFLHPFAAQFDHFIGQYLFSYMQSLRTIFDIDLARDHIRDDSNGSRDILYQRGAFLRVVTGVLAEQGGFEADEISLVRLDISDKLRRVVVLRVAVRVFSVRQQHHIDVEPFLQEHVYSSQRRMNTCRITVIEHRDIGGEALYQPYLRPHGR